MEEFKYLGVLLMSEGRMEQEIDRWIGGASRVRFWQLPGYQWYPAFAAGTQLSRLALPVGNHLFYSFKH